MLCADSRERVETLLPLQGTLRLEINGMGVRDTHNTKSQSCRYKNRRTRMHADQPC